MCRPDFEAAWKRAVQDTDWDNLSRQRNGLNESELKQKINATLLYQAAYACYGNGLPAPQSKCSVNQQHARTIDCASKEIVNPLTLTFSKLVPCTAVTVKLAISG